MCFWNLVTMGPRRQWQRFCETKRQRHGCAGSDGDEIALHQQQTENEWKNSQCNTVTSSAKKNHKKENSLLKFLALNALELSAPASDVLLRNNSTNTAGTATDSEVRNAVKSQETVTSNVQSTTCRSASQQQSWFQLSGHPDCFAPAGLGTIWKKCSGGTEKDVYEALSNEPSLQDIVPKYYREVEYNGQTFIELQDLLYGFRDPNVMDIKMGTRTFLESEVKNSSARPDLYLKMIAVDPEAPNSEERKLQAVTKLRYMQFREEQSSTCSHGFRIEAMKFRGSPPVTDLKTVKSDEEVNNTLALFLGDRHDIKQRLVVRLNEIRSKLDRSHYFKTHEIVGSSILIIYDDTKIGAWLIDFAKTRQVPEHTVLTHRRPWVPGNHEEGFLFGLDHLIESTENLHTPVSKDSVAPSSSIKVET
ncbi:inositol-trisphosphate 3-kinase homolog isoform X1 [Rhopalosiphum maidis]|uniref:inositol-trisphosphate 3-kinase homolog isoform X1 n=1 Tax=Rhopalosiphum maidis TaxID=43146 RepID=UPI000F00A85C|nr:inositol-trisphosphate 3-kinase homolog isoform X1 [Rhopalosiphum maidis]XP_026811941.1 inositol-trisphosphate 3-kinase homolog isoform X1 [Rhopalosiphum maidis]